MAPRSDRSKQCPEQVWDCLTRESYLQNYSMFSSGARGCSKNWMRPGRTILLHLGLTWCLLGEVWRVLEC